MQLFLNGTLFSLYIAGFVAFDWAIDWVNE